MNKEILKKFGVTEEWISESAEKYEKGEFELSEPSSPIFYGTPNILKKNEQYVAISYPKEDISQVNSIAEERGIDPSAIYHLAIKQFLQTV